MSRLARNVAPLIVVGLGCGSLWLADGASSRAHLVVAMILPFLGLVLVPVVAMLVRRHHAIATILGAVAISMPILALFFAACALDGFVQVVARCAGVLTMLVVGLVWSFAGVRGTDGGEGAG